MVSGLSGLGRRPGLRCRCGSMRARIMHARLRSIGRSRRAGRAGRGVFFDSRGALPISRRQVFPHAGCIFGPLGVQNCPFLAHFRPFSVPEGYTSAQSLWPFPGRPGRPSWGRVSSTRKKRPGRGRQGGRRTRPRAFPAGVGGVGGAAGFSCRLQLPASAAWASSSNRFAVRRALE